MTLTPQRRWLLPDVHVSSVPDGIAPLWNEARDTPEAEVLRRLDAETMQQLIAEIAHHTGVGLFRRFALMQYWRAAPPPESPPMIGADGLHMTDAGYGCLAASLAKALALNWQAHRAAAALASDAAAKIADVGRTGSATAAGTGAR